MVDSTSKEVRPAVAKALNTLDKVFSGETLDTKPINMIDLSKTMTKLPYRQEQETIEHALSKLFDIAGGKIEGKPNKDIVENLKKLVIAA